MLPELINTVEKRCQTRRNKFFALFDRKVAEGRLSDVIDSTLGYALTYYHTVEADKYKECMNEKRTKKDFRLKNDDKRLCVRLPDGKSEEEVGPIYLVLDESEEFNEGVKKYILNGMREYNFLPEVPRFASSLMIDWDTSASFDDWLDRGLPEMVQKCCGRRTGDGREWVRVPCGEVPSTPTFVGSKHPTPSILGQWSTRISMTTGACNGVSFWPVKAGIRSSRIAR